MIPDLFADSFHFFHLFHRQPCYLLGRERRVSIMKKTIRKIPLIFAMMGLLAVSLLGCSSSGEPSSAPSDASAVSHTQTDSTQTSEETSPQTEKQQAVLYIGTQGDFKEYPYEYQGELKPETFTDMR
ncbi:MAG: hypothetical protein ACLUUJ_07920 [Acutalibacteraceae bacterium]